jgi:hypothetical protein
MIVAPALLHRVWTRRSLDVAPFLWVAPSALMFLVWEVASPGVLREVLGFYRNLDSDLPFLEELVWVPRTLWEEYGAAALVAVPVAMVAVRRPDTRLLALWTIASVLAVAIHPYKLARTLHPVVPVAMLVAGLVVAEHRRRAAIGAAAAAWAAWQLAFGIDRLRGNVEFVETHAAVAVVERAVVAAEDGAFVKVVSSGRRVAYSAVEAAIRMRGLPAWVYDTPPVLNLRKGEDYARHVVEAARPLVPGRTVWVAIADGETYKKSPRRGEKPPPAHPTVAASAAFEAAAPARGLRLIDRVEDPDGLTEASFWAD